MPPDLSPEFRLLVACCRWPQTPESLQAVRELAAVSLNWQRFLRVAVRQRVTALANAAIGNGNVTVPADVKAALERIGASVARHSLIQAAETIRILALLREAGIEALCVKGTALGMLAYGVLAMKFGRDIDILLRRDEFPAALRILEGQGYVPLHPVPQIPWLFEKWLDLTKDLEVVDRKRSFQVEIHWKLAENNYFSRELAKHLEPRAVEVLPGRTLDTLRDDVMFVYLCVHGARHGWFRLKWSADISALLAQASAADLQRYLAFARAHGMEPCVAQALMLCDSLFGVAVAAAPAAAYRKRWRYRVLERVALTMMTRGNAETEVWDIRFGAMPAVFSQFLLGGSWRYYLAELRLRSVSLADMEAVPLPRALGFLYPLLRLPMLVYRRVRDRGFMQGRPRAAKGT